MLRTGLPTVQAKEKSSTMLPPRLTPFER